MTDNPTDGPTPSTDEILAILRVTALQQQVTQLQIDHNTKAIAETRQLVEDNAQTIAQLIDRNRANIEDLVTTLTTYAEQAERDRLVLSAEILSLVTALRDRFGSNGHAAE